MPDRGVYAPDGAQLRHLRALHRRLLARAQAPLPDGLIPVVVAGVRVGLSSATIAEFLARHTPYFALTAAGLTLADTALDFTARSALLADAALRLRDAGLLRGWRDEALDVRPLPPPGRGAERNCGHDSGASAMSAPPPLARIERAACRALGINTVAVHLNAFSAGDGLWVAQRAAHKTVDPGLWDNLAGGMVAAAESERDALLRETWEEAGIQLTDAEVRTGSRIQITRTIPEGFMAETVQCFDTVLPADRTPCNRDGEVAAFESRPIDTVVAAIERDEFTLEAALVTVDSLLAKTNTLPDPIPAHGQ